MQLVANESNYRYPDVMGSRCENGPTQIISYIFIIVAIAGFAMLPYVPLPGTIAAKLTMEKESKMKLLLLVLGMSPHSFWYAYPEYFVS